MTNLCTACQSRPHPSHMWLCTGRVHGCYERLEQDLASIPALWKDLGITLSRQDVIGGGGRRGAEVALVFKPKASEVRYVLSNTIGTWARLLAESNGLQVPLRPAYWLLKNVQSLAMHEAAGEAAEEIAYAVRQAYSCVDRPPERLFAGPCPNECDGFLYAKPGDLQVVCPECEGVASVADRRVWMVNAAATQRVTKTTALSWVRVLMDKQIPDGTWDSWRQRGKLPAVDVNGERQLLFRFGDVRDLAISWMAKGRAA